MLELSTRELFDSTNTIFKHEMITILQEALYCSTIKSDEIWCNQNATFVSIDTLSIDSI